MARGQLGRAGASTGQLVGALIQAYFGAYGGGLGGSVAGGGGALGGSYIGDDATGSSITGSGPDGEGGGDTYLAAVQGIADERVRREENARNLALVEQLMELLVTDQNQGQESQRER